jgi:hypothetical protein
MKYKKLTVQPSSTKPFRKYLGECESVSSALDHIKKINSKNYKRIEKKEIDISVHKELVGLDATSVFFIGLIHAEGNYVAKYVVLDNSRVYAITHNTVRNLFGKW